MKNNIEKVYNKLPKKVNLKNHKVDLSAKDMYENASSIGRFRTDIEKELIKIFNTNAYLKEIFDEARENIYILENDLLDYEIKANELGIDPKSQDEYVYALAEKINLFNYVNDVEYLYDAIDDFR